MTEQSSSDKEEDPYKNCVLNSTTCFGRCGAYTRCRETKHGLLKITDLDLSTDQHIQHLQFSKISRTWSELELIENRVKSHLDGSSFICQHHRYYLGTSWEQKKQCAHPLHPKIKSGAKACPTKLAPMWVVDQLNEESPFSFVVGGRICRKHLALESSKKVTTAAQSNTSPEQADEQENSHGNDDDDDAADEPYVPDEIYVPEAVQSTSSTAGREMTQMLCITPPRFQINKTPVERIADSTKREAKRKIEQVKESSVRYIAECIAPNQSEKLLTSLYESDNDEEETLPPDLAPLLEAYKASDPQGKLIVLSLVNHSTHSSSTIQRVFGCSKYLVEKARKVKASTKGVSIQPKTVFRRNRMNTDKCEHFIQFLFSSGLLQDVAYGVTKLKFDSGSEQTIPHAVLTTRYSHAIAFYLQICKDADFQPLSERSLSRILNALKPSQRKCLSGLDDITAAGMTGFDKLIKFITDCKRDKAFVKETVGKLEAGRRYLKTVYQTRCSMDSTIATHNSVFGLSKTKSLACQSRKMSVQIASI